MIALLEVSTKAGWAQSLLVPLKAIVLNIISVAAAWGIMVWVWQEGNL